MTRRASKIDANQNLIVKALRDSGCRVAILSGVGKGFPDLLVCRGKLLYLLEVKSEKGSLTEDQENFIALGWPVNVVRTVNEAIDASWGA